MLDRLAAMVTLEFVVGFFVGGVAAGIVSTLLLRWFEHRFGAISARRRQQDTATITYLRRSSAARDQHRRREMRRYFWATMWLMMTLALLIVARLTDDHWGWIGGACVTGTVCSHALLSASRISDQLDASMDDDG
jgi:hypothetical protein